MSNYAAPEATGIFDRSNAHKKITAAVGTSLFLASVTLAALLLWHALHLRDTTGQVSTLVRLGPIPLIELGRSATEATFHWLPGLMWYYAAWLIGGVSFAGLLLRKR